MSKSKSVSVFDENFEVRSTLRTIRENTELLQTLTGRDRQSLRNANKKLRAKVNALRGAMMEQYDTDWIECRDVGHVWQKAFTEIEMDGICIRMLSCVRCETERSETFNSDGLLLSRRYRHPAGYLMEGPAASMLGGNSKDFWRGIEYLSFEQRRAIEPADDEAIIVD